MRPADCIGCGYCCMQATCVTGLDAYGLARQQCPGLELKEGRFWCRLVTESSGEKNHLIRTNLCIGAGCSSSLFNNQREACQRGVLEKYLTERSTNALSSF